MKLLGSLILSCFVSSPGFAVNVRIGGQAGAGGAPVFSPGIVRALDFQVRALEPFSGNPRMMAQTLLQEAYPASVLPARANSSGVAAALIIKRALAEPKVYSAVQKSLAARPNPLTEAIADNLADLREAIRTDPKARAVIKNTFKPLEEALSSNRPLGEISAAIASFFTGSRAYSGGPNPEPLVPAPPKNAAGKYLNSVVSDNLFNSPSGGAITRGIEKYAFRFGDRFLKRILRADGRDHVVDLGAGEAVFAMELAGQRPIGADVPDKLRRSLDRRPRNKLPKVTAVSFTIKDSGVKASENFRPLKDRYFEDIPDAELLGDFGKVTLATDMWGILAYTAQPSVVLRKMHALLADEGEFYLKVGARNYQAPRSAMSGRLKAPLSSLYASSVRTHDGRTVSFPDWLRRLPGFKVTVLEGGGVLLIQKDPKRRLRVPDLRLGPKIDASSMPPARVFFEK